MKFRAGRIVATPDALEAVPRMYINAALTRHLNGDWGNVSPADKRENDRALRQGERLLSSYHTPGGIKFWIITEADRSATTILLPSEY